MSVAHPSPARTLPSPVVLWLAREEGVFGGRLRDDPAYSRVRPGVYANRAEWSPLPPWQRYLARVHAYALLHPDAVFCLESAAALLGLPIFGEARDIHVFDVQRDSTRRSGDVVVHAGATHRALVVGELVTTSVLDTSVDLIRVLPPAFALAVADAAARLMPVEVSAAALRDVLDAQPSSRGRARAAWVVSRLDARSESVGESVSRAVIEWCGFPPPVLQQWFESDGFRDRTDFFFPSVRVIGEADGYGKYLTADAADPSRLIAEKEREDRLRRQVRGFARWSYRDALLVDPLRSRLSAAGVPQERPAATSWLATLRQNPRSK